MTLVSFDPAFLHALLATRERLVRTEERLDTAMRFIEAELADLAPAEPGPDRFSAHCRGRVERHLPHATTSLIASIGGKTSQGWCDGSPQR